FEPVEGIEAASHDPRALAVLIEYAESFVNRGRLKEFELRHYVTNHCHNCSPVSSLNRWLNVSRQMLTRRLAHFERGQNEIRGDRRAADDFVTERIRQRIENCRASATDGRFADTAGAHRGFRIRNIESSPVHAFGRQVENGWRLVLI